MSTLNSFPDVHVTDANAIQAEIIEQGNGSSTFACGATTLCGFVANEIFSGISVFFDVGLTPDNMAPLYDGAPTPALVAYTFPPIASGKFSAITIPPAIFAGFPFIKLNFSTTLPPGAPVLRLALRPV